MSLPKGYINTEALATIAKLLNNIKQRSYDVMNIQIGNKVLDVGCGPGTDTITLGTIVRKHGLVIGADYDLTMLATANSRAEQGGLSAWVKHLQADAASLPFATDFFDSSRSERLFQHLPFPQQALSEMVRVTKPGGWIVVLDPDWGSLSIDTTEIDIERRLASFVANTAVHNGFSGRSLYRLFKQQQLNDIGFEVFPVTVTRSAFFRESIQADRTEQDAVAAGIFSDEDICIWRNSQAQADADGVYFASVNLILMAGRKP